MKIEPVSNRTLDKTAVLKEIRAALEHETRINLHRYPIHTTFQEDDLLLEGEVANIAAKKLALEISGAISGVGRIVDRLRVAPANPMGDGAVLNHVRDALLQEPTLEQCAIQLRAKDRIEIIRAPAAEQRGNIDVAVEEGVVTLNGKVPSLSHKRLAGALAWWVPGSRDVINGLEEGPPEEDSDDEVVDAVRLVLEKDPLVNSSSIRVSARGYVVTLEGLVPSLEMREIAEFDAWYVFGVDRVVNQLEVRA